MSFDQDRAACAHYLFAHLRELLSPVEALADAIADRAAHGNRALRSNPLLESLRAHSDEDTWIAAVASLTPGASDPSTISRHAAAEAWTHIRLQALERIEREAPHALEIARCPACSAVLRTPSARQCLACGADWH